ncbi:MAG: guanylate kinase [Lachnospiraceae bacterium]|nr:guanylate kinase [Lachnospiraceae bacterium]
MQKEGLVTVLSGFSGAGKGTIMKRLLEKYPGKYNLSISATTRSPRPGEEEGREYFFKTTEEFEKMIAEGEFLEHARFGDNYYGTPRGYVDELLEQGRNVILEIEVQGALQVRKIYPHALLLFVTPPSAAELKRRLTGRQTETEEVIAKRLGIAARESHLMVQYDFLIVNDVLEEAVDNVDRIITSEAYRSVRNISAIERMQEELKEFSKGE